MSEAFSRPQSLFVDSLWWCSLGGNKDEDEELKEGSIRRYSQQGLRFGTVEFHRRLILKFQYLISENTLVTPRFTMSITLCPTIFLRK